MEDVNNLILIQKIDTQSIINQGIAFIYDQVEKVDSKGVYMMDVTYFLPISPGREGGLRGRVHD